MEDLKFQVVVQFEASTPEDFSALLELTEAIESGLANEPEEVVDGHDYGMGEFNIFVHTNEPQTTFERVVELIDTRKPGLPFSAGYRDFNEDYYIPLWPPNSKSFYVA
jgi:hypothetical protein